MGLAAKQLTEEQKAHYKSLLTEAKIPDRYFNAPLKTHNDAGITLRSYMKEEYAEDASLRRGCVVVHGSPGIAQSFTRDIVIAGASAEFYYLQTFANRLDIADTLPQSYVIEWFEQEADCPYSPRERFNIETRISQLIDDQVIFYLFTSVYPTNSKWWSRQFMDIVTNSCRIIGVKNGNRQRGERTSVSDSQVSRSEDTRRSKRVTVR